MCLRSRRIVIGKDRGEPKRLFCNYGWEFSSQVLDLWAYQSGVKIDFSRTGNPTDNGHIESFNGTFRDECLNTHWFTTLADDQPGSFVQVPAREFTSQHGAVKLVWGGRLGYRSPAPGACSPARSAVARRGSR